MIRSLEITTAPADHPSTLEFISSDATLDRYHEIIDPAGWRLATYQKNPVFQNAHHQDNIIHTIGRALVTEVRQVAGRPVLYQKIQFATHVNPIARIAYGLYRGKFLNSVSVGFIPVRWEDGCADSPFRRKYVEQELLEVSAVAIPANPAAVALASKSGAVEKSDLKETIDLLRHITSNPEPETPPQPKTENQNSKIPDDQSILHHLRELRSLLKHM